MGRPIPAELRATFRRHPDEWAIPCPVPTCRAKAGIQCRTAKGRPLTVDSHPSRLDHWLTHHRSTP
jgi:hypothetical protein